MGRGGWSVLLLGRCRHEDALTRIHSPPHKPTTTTIAPPKKQVEIRGQVVGGGGEFTNLFTTRVACLVCAKVGTDKYRVRTVRAGREREARLHRLGCMCVCDGMGWFGWSIHRVGVQLFMSGYPLAHPLMHTHIHTHNRKQTETARDGAGHPRGLGRMDRSLPHAGTGGWCWCRSIYINAIPSPPPPAVHDRPTPDARSYMTGEGGALQAAPPRAAPPARRHHHGLQHR